MDFGRRSNLFLIFYIEIYRVADNYDAPRVCIFATAHAIKMLNKMLDFAERHSNQPAANSNGEAPELDQDVVRSERRAQGRPAPQGIA
jgi:hypothetical protein